MSETKRFLMVDEYSDVESSGAEDEEKKQGNGNGYDKGNDNDDDSDYKSTDSNVSDNTKAAKTAAAAIAAARMKKRKEEDFDFVRNQFYFLSEKTGTKKARVKCKHCGSEKSYDEKRALKHLVLACPGITPETHKEAHQKYLEQQNEASNLMDELDRKPPAKATKRTRANEAAATGSTKRKAVDSSSDGGDDSASPPSCNAKNQGDTDVQADGDGGDETTDEVMAVEEEIRKAELARLKATLTKLDAEQQILETKRLTYDIELSYRKKNLHSQYVKTSIEMAFGLLEKRQKLIDQGIPLATIDQLLPLSLVADEDEDGGLRFE